MREKLTLDKCIGKTAIANNGLKMTIIGGVSLADITVQFEDGAIVTHKCHSAFKRGRIAHPTVKSIRHQNIPKISRVGEQSISYNGEKVVIVAYRHCKDIDVQFEDGTIVNTTYESFLCRKLKNPNFYKTNYIGNTSVAVNGLKMTVIAYRTSKDIDVRFEDGVVVRHKTYRMFKLGKIGHPTVKPDRHKNRVGEENNAYCGLNMTIVDYINTMDMTVQFEDGYTVSGVRYSYFKQGYVKHPTPYMLNNIKVTKRAYVYKQETNYYCKCTRCGLVDIMNVEEIKNHICIDQLKK